MNSLAIDTPGAPLTPPSTTPASSSGAEVAMLARALCDPGAPPPVPGIDAARLVAAAVRHRVLLPAGWLLRDAGTLSGWPTEFGRAFQHRERDGVAVDCLRHAELGRVLEAMKAAGLRVVLFKGAALAHTHYPAPHVRPRADTDLLAAAPDVPAVERILARFGYRRQTETSGRLVSYQSHYDKVDRYGVGHAFDVHWKISNLQALADRLSHEEIWSGRVPLAAFGGSACAAGDAHALLLALVHRAGHHPGSRNLLWIYDVHLLATRLSGDRMTQVRELATARGLNRLAADGLALARETFATTFATPVIEELRAARPGRPQAIVDDVPSTQAHVLRLDLDALPTWRARAGLLREHVLPSPAYIRARYGVHSSLALPALYIWRVLAGAPKWLRRRPVDD